MRCAITSVVFLLLFGVVFADEGKDALRTLTPEQAKEEIQYENDRLELEDVTAVTPEVAAILAKHKGGELSLPALKSLAPDVAAVLSAYKGELALDGLETLSAETAAALACHEGGLSLCGVSSIADDAASAVAKHKGDIYMAGLRELHCEPLARALLLSSDGLRSGFDESDIASISPEVAELFVIRGQGSRTLMLPQLKAPTSKVLDVLSRLNGDLQIGVQSLNAEMAKILAQHRGGTLHVAVKDIEALRMLMQHEGGPDSALSLTIPDATPEIATVLAGFDGFICLDWPTVPVEVEKILAGSETAYFLIDPVEMKTPEFAAKLVKSRSLRGGDRAGHWGHLQDVPLPVAKELAEFPWLLVLPAVERLTPEATEALAQCNGKLALPGLKELTSVPLARKLAEAETEIDGRSKWPEFWFRKGLGLRHVTEMSPEVARALASLDGGLLALNGLTAITDEVAEALSHFSGDLMLEGITELSVHSEQLLGHGRSKLIFVPNLRRLMDPAFAKKVLTHQQLESVSDDALSVLVEREYGGEFRHTGHWANRSMNLRLTELTSGQAAILATRQAGAHDMLCLNSVRHLDAETAAALAQARIDISLAGLRELTPEVAAAFADHGGTVYFRGLERLPVEVARSLASKKRGMIRFEGLCPSQARGKDEPLELPDESAALLQKHPHVTLPLKLDY